MCQLTKAVDINLSVDFKQGNLMYNSSTTDEIDFMCSFIYELSLKIWYLLNSNNPHDQGKIL